MITSSGVQTGAGFATISLLKFLKIRVYNYFRSFIILNIERPTHQ